MKTKHNPYACANPFKCAICLEDMRIQDEDARGEERFNKAIRRTLRAFFTAKACAKGQISKKQLKSELAKCFRETL